MEPPGPATGRPDGELREIRVKPLGASAGPGLRDRRRSLHPGYNLRRRAIETRILHKPTVIFIFVRQQALEKRSDPVADRRRSIHCPADAVLGY